MGVDNLLVVVCVRFVLEVEGELVLLIVVFFRTEMLLSDYFRVSVFVYVSMKGVNLLVVVCFWSGLGVEGISI